MASHGNSIFTSKMGTEERAKKRAAFIFALVSAKRSSIFTDVVVNTIRGWWWRHESFLFLLCCLVFDPFFRAKPKTGSRFINVILRGVYSTLQMPPVSFQRHHESLILTHLYSASILSFLPRYSGNETTTRGSALTRLSTKLPSHKNSKVYL